MLSINKKTNYNAFGLFLKSEILFPELVELNESRSSFDVIVEFEDLSELFDDLNKGNRFFIVEDKIIMFKLPEIAIFCILGHSKIMITPLENYDEDIVRIWILGTCMGAILMRNMIFPLHGSAVAIQGKAYAFIGESGAGKSTIASTFLKNGFHFLTDDIIAISFKEDNTPVVIPSYPQQKLWEESLNYLGMERKNYRSIFGRENKFCIPVDNYISKPLPLHGIFELEKYEKSEPQLTEVMNLEKFKTLFTHTYRNFLIERLNLIDWHFQMSAKILNKVNLYKFERPVSGFSGNKMLDTFLNSIEGGKEYVNAITLSIK